MKTDMNLRIEFDQNNTQLIKGIAIITMIIHHCISIPSGFLWVDMFGSAMKICISYFTFLVGFGYSFSKNKTIKGGISRSINLLQQFWIILFTIFIPLHLIDYPSSGISFYHLITNMFGLESNLHHFSWYLYFYIYSMIIMPFAAKLIDKYKWKAVISLVMTTYVLEVLVHSIPNWDCNIFTQAAFDCLFNSPLLFLGYYMARFSIYNKVLLQKRYTIPLIVLCILIIILAMLKRVVMGFMLDFIYIPLIIFSILGVFTLHKLEVIRVGLLKLGGMSMLMWFIHALFIMPFQSLAWSIAWIDENPLLKSLIVILFSYILAISYSRIHKTILKRALGLKMISNN